MGPFVCPVHTTPLGSTPVRGTARSAKSAASTQTRVNKSGTPKTPASTAGSGPPRRKSGDSPQGLRPRNLESQKKRRRRRDIPPENPTSIGLLRLGYRRPTGTRHCRFFHRIAQPRSVFPIQKTVPGPGQRQGGMPRSAPQHGRRSQRILHQIRHAIGVRIVHRLRSGTAIWKGEMEFPPGLPRREPLVAPDIHVPPRQTALSLQIAFAGLRHECRIARIQRG
jgi:hypothetical protein